MKSKIKTHSGAKKRFKITKSKKVLFDKSCNNHLLTNKGDTREKDSYGKALNKTDAKNIKNLLPYT